MTGKLISLHKVSLVRDMKGGTPGWTAPLLACTVVEIQLYEKQIAYHIAKLISL